MSMARQQRFVDIAGYRIVRRIGQGGMATVYLATQIDLNRTVALKVLSSERAPNAESVARFENEARTIARLDHPHIVSIHEVGRSDDDQLYFSMPWLPRGDLTTQPKRREPQRIIEIMRALLDALAYAHEQGVVHRDVKPENVLFDAQNRPQLADFGIALSLREDLRVTRAGSTVGSSGYMSLEQARGLPTDGRADLYSVGVMLYELLTGAMPYQGEDALSVAIAHAEDPVPTLPQALAVWQPLIDGALAKQPEDRFADARAMRAALDRAAQNLHAGKRAGTLRYWWRRARTGGVVGAWVAAAALVATLAVLAVLALTRPQQPRAVADSRAAVASSRPAPVKRVVTGTRRAPLGADQLDGLIAEGNARLSAGALVEPPGHGAADDFLRVLQIYPANPEALAGLRGVFDALRGNIEHALAAGNADTAAQWYRKAQRLADHGGIRERPFWPAFVDATEKRVARALDAAARAGPQQLAALQPLATALDLPLPKPQPRPARAATDGATALQPGAALRDDDGPPLIVVSTAAGDAYALGRSEVTRAAYARFVLASGRKASGCRRLHNVFSAILSLDWLRPGFKQSAHHPAVCVSWQDARAYAGWLSLRTGKRYRLPSSAEWLAAARDQQLSAPCHGGGCAGSGEGTHAVAASPAGQLLDMHGNVSEWMQCSGQCRQVTFRGRSWRSGPGSVTDHSDPDTGYTSVGFRVLRELRAADTQP